MSEGMMHSADPFACDHRSAYECVHCDERHCWDCDAPTRTEVIKTAAEYCPRHRERGRLGQLEDKRFITDDLGQLDAGALESEPKPCCRRINWFDPSTKARMVTWCTRDHGHDGECSGQPPRVVELDDLGPASSKRRRW